MDKQLRLLHYCDELSSLSLWRELLYPWYLFCSDFYFIFTLNVVIAAALKLLQSCPTLCDPIDESPPGSPVPGILQARTLEWVAISFSNSNEHRYKNPQKILANRIQQYVNKNIHHDHVGFNPGMQDSSIFANQSMWYTILRNWRIKIIWLFQQMQRRPLTKFNTIYDKKTL